MMLQPHLSAPRAPRPYGSCYGEASVTNVTAAADNSSSTWGTCFSGDDAAMRKIDTEHEMLIKDELTFLAGLVALVHAPDGAVVVYGLPGLGAVVVLMNEEVRRKARNLFDMMLGA